ncbi:hypothetical protein HOD30_01380 [Candidatus Peregrinibacteria bacterium]|jgi:hypothetical protein|nr:hypothetical protein [Candidatus Peregrinibacteria bacterium]MBT4632245.1 hypothetical protein [Candidatus Peregrinibacteria bacterium]MBT5516641.1 hypothetical protein [Candidatus Peregrinibacteria bacterium]MBT5824344.1 hypothetical protein [Candidatus Peregrinibacteria bacterium]
MNETTLLLAQLMGPVLLVMGLSGLVNKGMYMDWRKQLTGKNMHLVFMGIVEFVAGIAVVLTHNLWGNFTEILVTLMGWGMLFEGLLLLIATDAYGKTAGKFMMPSLIKLASILGVLLGGYLVWVAYL